LAHFALSNVPTRGDIWTGASGPVQGRARPVQGRARRADGRRGPFRTTWVTAEELDVVDPGSLDPSQDL